MKVKQLLMSKGYQLLWKEMTDAEETFYIRSACEYSFVSSDGKVSLEPHWEFAQTKYGITINSEDLWRRLGDITVEETTVPTFLPEEVLLIICLNGNKDRWQSLKLICDLVELIRAHPEMDWDRLLESADSWGCKRIVAIGLLLAHDMMGTHLKDNVWNWVQADPVAKLMAAANFLLSYDTPSHTCLTHDPVMKYQINLNLSRVFEMRLPWLCGQFCD